MKQTETFPHGNPIGRGSPCGLHYISKLPRSHPQVRKHEMGGGDALISMQRIALLA